MDIKSSSDFLATSFLDLFPSRFDSSTKHITSKTWRAVSQWHHLSDQEILDSITAGSSLLRAVKRGDFTRFAVLTVGDSQSPLVAHVAKNLTVLKEKSSLAFHQYFFAEAAYFYFFLNEQVITESADAVLSAWLDSLNLGVDQALVRVIGGNEAIPLPLQSGFSWCESASAPAINRNDLPLKEALELFLSNSSEAMSFEAYSKTFDMLPVCIEFDSKQTTSPLESLIDQSSHTFHARQEVSAEKFSKPSEDDIPQSVTGQSRQAALKESRQLRQTLKTLTESTIRVASPSAPRFMQLSLPILETDAEMRAPPS